METQKTSKSQNGLEKKEYTGCVTLPNFKLFYEYSDQNCMVLAQKWTHRSMEQNRESRNETTLYMGNSPMTKEARCTVGEKNNLSNK